MLSEKDRRYYIKNKDNILRKTKYRAMYEAKQEANYIIKQRL